MSSSLQLTDLDRRIWEEELAEFVPPRIFDVHAHVYRRAHNLGTDSAASAAFPESDWALLDACDRRLMPGREVHRLAFGFPYAGGCDFAAANRFTAAEARRDPDSAALMLVHPAMTDDELDQQLDAHGFLGFKPYRFYSTSGDAVDCRITDFLPEHQIRVADRRGLLVMLHLAKRDGAADSQNLADLERLSTEYPRVKWILAHCARSYFAAQVARAGPRLARLASAWYDVSSVCDSDAVRALIDSVGPPRVMYGSDDLPVGVLRGKYITFGRAWAWLSEENHSLDLSHCDPRMTFVRYEQLRAMRQAARGAGLSRAQIEDLFANTAQRLLALCGRHSG